MAYANGQLTKLTYPSGLVIDYVWDAGEISAIQINGQPLLSDIKWTGDGQAIAWRFANGQQAFKPQNTVGRNAGVTYATSAAVHGYDAAGNLTAVQTAGGEGPEFNSRFAYDGQDRLIESNINTKLSTYQYDATGNRVQNSNATQTILSEYADNSHRLASTTQNGKTESYQYDAMGNLVGDGIWTHQYDSAGRLVRSEAETSQLNTALTSGNTASSMTVVTYAYNGEGLRVSKTVAVTNQPIKTTHYVYDLAANLVGEYDQDGNILQETIWLNGQPVAMMQGGDWTNLDSLHYIWTDALGTPREITNANTQKLVWRWANSDPFGQNKAQAVSGFEYNLRFAGQVYDKETGLHYNHFRDYNPKTGRYIQSDPIGLNGGINSYAYVGNNPLGFVDPLGLIRDSVSTYCRAHPKDCMAAGLLPVPALLNPPKIPPLPGFCIDLPNILNPDIPPYLPFPLNVVLPIIPHLPAFDGDKTDNNAKGKPADGPSFPPYMESSNGGGGLPPISPNIHPGKQGKHQPSHNNWDENKNRSPLNPKINPQELLDGYHSGLYPEAHRDSHGRPVVDFGKEIGTVRDENAGNATPTQYGTIHDSNTGAHIVPAYRPNSKF